MFKANQFRSRVHRTQARGQFVSPSMVLVTWGDQGTSSWEISGFGQDIASEDFQDLRQAELNQSQEQKSFLGAVNRLYCLDESVQPTNGSAIQ